MIQRGRQQGGSEGLSLLLAATDGACRGWCGGGEGLMPLRLLSPLASGCSCLGATTATILTGDAPKALCCVDPLASLSPNWKLSKPHVWVRSGRIHLTGR